MLDDYSELRLPPVVCDSNSFDPDEAARDQLENNKRRKVTLTGVPRPSPVQEKSTWRSGREIADGIKNPPVLYPFPYKSEERSVLFVFAAVYPLIGSVAFIHS